MTELAIGVLTGERPLDGSALYVAPPLPFSHLFGEDLLVADSSVQALASEHRDLDFSHVQPATVLWRVVEDDPAQQLRGFAHAKNLDEALAEVRVEVVNDQMNSSRRAINDVDQVLNESDEVRLSPVVRDLGNPATALRFNSDEDVARTGSDVFVVLPPRCSRHHRQTGSALMQQLLALLVDADHRLVLTPGLGVQIEKVVHPLPILLGQRTDAPHQFSPGLEAVFFSNRRIVSRLMSCIPGRPRASRSSKTSVQRLAPTGGCEQASAVTSASTSVSYLRGAPGRWISRSARSSPPSRYAARVRQIAVRPTPRTWQITASGTFPSSAANICARLTSRAWRKPFLRHSSSALRSLLDSLKSVWCMALPSSIRWEQGHCIHDSLFTCLSTSRADCACAGSPPLHAASAAVFRRGTANDLPVAIRQTAHPCRPFAAL